MCLIVVAVESHPDYPLIAIGNRDEFYARPTRPAHFWDDHPAVFAGRDLQDVQQGTWMGLNTQGRFAAVTNFRELDVGEPIARRSRGELTKHFLATDVALGDYLATLDETAAQYKGYNLLLWEHNALYHASNRHGAPRKLDAGIYGLSNGVLDAPWPKTVLAKQRLQQALQSSPPSFRRRPEPSALIALLLDNTPAPDDALPDTGIDIESERLLSSCFIHSEQYGTRATTVVMMHRDGSMIFLEQNWKPFAYDETHTADEQRFLHCVR